MKRKFKQVLCSILSVAIIFTVSACKDNSNNDINSQQSEITSSDIQSNISSETNSNIQIDTTFNPVMWQVELDNEQKFYLVGSYHAGDFDIKSIPEVYRNAFDSCDYLAVECNTNAIMSDYNSILDMTMKYIYADGSTLKDHISEETYNKLVDYLKNNSNEYTTLSTILNYMSAEYWAMYVETPLIYKSGLDTEKGIDYQLMDLAEETKKTIISIENYEDSLNAFSGFSDLFYEVQILSYVANANGIQEYIDEFKEMYNLWKSGSKELSNVINGDDEELNIDISKELEDKINSNEQQLSSEYEKFNKQMITDRNEIMINSAIDYIKEGKNVFFVVGAAHMYGDDGVIQALKDNGYTINQVCGEKLD